MITRALRAWWRFKFRRARAAAARMRLDDASVAWAWARAGHLNTSTGQVADVMLRRARRAGFRVPPELRS